MIKVFGEHDEKTVQQLWTCMGVGSVYKGVLCADGHYGYAQRSAVSLPTRSISP